MYFITSTVLISTEIYFVNLLLQVAAENILGNSVNKQDQSYCYSIIIVNFKSFDFCFRYSTRFYYKHSLTVLWFFAFFIRKANVDVFHFDPNLNTFIKLPTFYKLNISGVHYINIDLT